MMPSSFLGTGSVLALVLAAAPLAAQVRMVEAHLDSAVRRTMSLWQVPGLVLVVVKDDQSIVRGYGTRAVGEERPVNSDTRVQIASHSKAVTATALAILVAEERLSWDDPIRKHIPEFSVDHPVVSDLITVRDLVAHRAGLPAPAFGGFRNADYSVEDLLDTLRVQRPEPFRHGQIYSQPSIALAGEVVARVSGVPWESFVRERIFGPLGMIDSYTSNPDLIERFGLPSSEKNIFIPARNRGGTITLGGWSAIGTHRLYAPAGGITTTGTDMAKWIAFLLREGAYDGGRLAPPGALAETLEPLIPLDPLLRAFTDPIAPLGTGTLGWTAVSHLGRTVYFAPGGWMSSTVAVVPDENLGVAVFTNAYFSERHAFESLFPVFALTMEVIDLTLDIERTDWNARFAEALAAVGN